MKIRVMLIASISLGLAQIAVAGNTLPVSSADDDDLVNATVPVSPGEGGNAPPELVESDVESVSVDVRTVVRLPAPRLRSRVP